MKETFYFILFVLLTMVIVHWLISFSHVSQHIVFGVVLVGMVTVGMMEYHRHSYTSAEIIWMCFGATKVHWYYRSALKFQVHRPASFFWNLCWLQKTYYIDDVSYTRPKAVRSHETCNDQSKNWSLVRYIGKLEKFLIVWCQL